jgi:hypothetical protein
MNRWSSYNLAADAMAGSIGLMAGIGVARAAYQRRWNTSPDLK